MVQSNGSLPPEGPGGQEPTLGRTSTISGKILCLFGGLDSLIPADQVDAVKASLTAAGVDHDTVIYPDADHGFFCDQRGTYQKDAATDAWARVKALFAEKLQG